MKNTLTALALFGALIGGTAVFGADTAYLFDVVKGADTTPYTSVTSKQGKVECHTLPLQAKATAHCKITIPDAKASVPIVIQLVSSKGESRAIGTIKGKKIEFANGSNGANFNNALALPVINLP